MSDWLPTLLHFADFDLHTLPDDMKGVDQYEMLVSNAATEDVYATRKEIIYQDIEAYRWLWHIPSNFVTRTCRYEDFKIRMHGTGTGESSEDYALFNLKEDESEKTDLSSSNPEKRDELYQRLLAALTDREPYETILDTETHSGKQVNQTIINGQQVATLKLNWCEAI